MKHFDLSDLMFIIILGLVCAVINQVDGVRDLRIHVAELELWRVNHVESDRREMARIEEAIPAQIPQGIPGRILKADWDGEPYWAEPPEQPSPTAALQAGSTIITTNPPPRGYCGICGVTH